MRSGNVLKRFMGIFEIYSPTDDYQCSGDVEIDFPGLCALMDVEDIPSVSIKCPVSQRRGPR